MSKLTEMDIAEIARQADVLSRPLRTNFANVKAAINDTQDQIDALVTPESPSEVVNARDYFPSLRERMRAPDKLAMNALVEGGAVTPSVAVTGGANVAAGSAVINGIGTSWPETDTAAIPGCATGKRIDVVVVNSDNTVSVVVGAEHATDPAMPAVASSQRPLATIYRGTEAVFLSSQVSDARWQGCFVNRTAWYFSIQDALTAISSGTVLVLPGKYIEEVQITGKSHVELRFEKGAKLYRESATKACLRQTGAASFLTIRGGEFYGGPYLPALTGKAGSRALVELSAATDFEIEDAWFDGNALSSAAYRNLSITGASRFFVRKNWFTDGAGNIDYTTLGIEQSSAFEVSPVLKQYTALSGTSPTLRLFSNDMFSITLSGNTTVAVDLGEGGGSPNAAAGSVVVKVRHHATVDYWIKFNKSSHHINVNGATAGKTYNCPNEATGGGYGAATRYTLFQLFYDGTVLLVTQNPFHKVF